MPPCNLNDWPSPDHRPERPNECSNGGTGNLRRRFFWCHPTILAALTALLSLGILGCDDATGEHGAKTVSFAQPGPIPAAEQRAGDPEAGRDALLNNAYVTCGAPLAAYERVASGGDSTPALPGRHGRNATLPYALTAHTNPDGVELVTSNCLACHAAELDGELVIGLGNEFLDFTADPMENVENLGLYVRPGAETKAWEKWAERVAAMAPYMITDTVGVNPANNLTLALLAHRDAETLGWSETPLLEPPPEKPLPVSVPPWWRMQKKHAMFYDAQGRGDHARYMMLISTVCTDTVEEAEEIDAYFPDIRAYIASLRAPAYPYAVDQDLAASGQDVFLTHCARCHGTYGDDWTYPNLLVALEEVGTDPELARRSYDDSERFFAWFANSFYGELAEAAPGPGYVAPPLDGVWATAPYLHNGSVPSLATLLESARRPRFWAHSDGNRRYDMNALGWSHESLPTGKNSVEDAAVRSRVYDTTLTGYSNAGHEFGDVLTDRERSALLEYLKTL